MKIATIIGARPQFIKASMISMEILKYDYITETTIHTGQHFDSNMSQIFFNEMEIPKPNYNLNINSLSHGAMTGRQLEEIEKILIKEKPDWVFVYGDTNSTLAGALAASKIHIPIAHIEAGLRSYNRKMPEEINRILSDHISSLLFCPTETAVKNLRKEGIYEGVYNVGDIMYDATLHFSDIAKKKSTILKELNLEPKEYILLTVHRQENTVNSIRLNNIFSALDNSHMPIVMPLHPRTKMVLNENNIILSSIIKPIEPVGFFDMIMLEKNAFKIITDSGGIQKEAFFHHIPCITIRDQTEWVELIDTGANILTGTDTDKIIAALNGKFSFSNDNIFGSGNTAGKILKHLFEASNDK